MENNTSRQQGYAQYNSLWVSWYPNPSKGITELKAVYHAKERSQKRSTERRAESGEQREQKEENESSRSTVINGQGSKSQEQGVKNASHKELEEKRELTPLHQVKRHMIQAIWTRKQPWSIWG